MVEVEEPEGVSPRHYLVALAVKWDQRSCGIEHPTEEIPDACPATVDATVELGAAYDGPVRQSVARFEHDALVRPK